MSDIFAKYCTPPPQETRSALKRAPEGAFMDENALDRWAADTNGQPFSEETKEELREFIDMTEEGHLK